MYESNLFKVLEILEIIWCTCPTNYWLHEPRDELVSVLKTEIDVLLEKTPEWVWKEEQNINDKIVSEYVKYLMVVEENKDNVEGNVRRFKGGLEGFYGKVNPEQLKKVSDF